MRRVATTVEEQRLNRSRYFGTDCLHLFQCSVFIISALDDQRGASDSRQVLLDGPVAEPIAEPHLSPRLEQKVHIRSMMTLEALAQAARAIGAAYVGNARDGHVLDEYMWRLEDECDWRRQLGTGVDESDRSTVAVAKQDGSIDVQDLEEPREHFESFAVHEVLGERRDQWI